jgi:hypothetical protein
MPMGGEAPMHTRAGRVTRLVRVAPFINTPVLAFAPGRTGSVRLRIAGGSSSTPVAVERARRRPSGGSARCERKRACRRAVNPSLGMCTSTAPAAASTLLTTPIWPISSGSLITVFWDERMMTLGGGSRCVRACVGGWPEQLGDPPHGDAWARMPPDTRHVPPSPPHQSPALMSERPLRAGPSPPFTMLPCA